MRHIFGFWYALLLLGVIAVFALARVNAGSVLILSFDGDAVHMAQIVLRIAEGDIPHQDFMTPLGIMAFLPIVWLVNLGAGIGAAFAYAPVFLGVFIFPALYWVGVSRLKPGAAVVFAGVVLVQLNALVHGGVEPTVAVSMYYNNWCWAISAVVVALAVLPSERQGRLPEIAEPIFIGFGVGLLILIKATFAVFLLPAVVAGLLVRQQYRLLGGAVVWCLVFMVVVTVPFGAVGYWQGYIGDLLFVAGSPSRAQPGDPIALMVLSPPHFVAVVCLAAGFVFLRQAKLMGYGIVFLLLAIGWVLVTHQNWQNDAHWLILAGLVLWALRDGVVLYNRFGWPLHGALGAVSIAFFALGTPLLVTQMQSLLIHSGANSDQFAVASIDPRARDLKFQSAVEGRFMNSVPSAALTAKQAEPTVLNGETLPDCTRSTGLIRSLMAMGAALDDVAQTEGKQVLHADWVNGLWLFSKTNPLQGGAPWFYGGALGLESVDLVVVPLCPFGQAVRRLILHDIADKGIALEESFRNSMFILLKKRT